MTGNGLAAGEDGRGEVDRRLPPPWCFKTAMLADVGVTQVTVQNGYRWKVASVESKLAAEP